MIGHRDFSKFSSIFSYVTRFQRISFDFVSNYRPRLLRKSKELLWKPEKYENIEEKFEKSQCPIIFFASYVDKMHFQSDWSRIFLGCGRRTFSQPSAMVPPLKIAGTDTVIATRRSLKNVFIITPIRV